MPPAGALTLDLRHVDSRIWQACAGTTVQIPAVNSRVYYFPQGHLEQSSSASPALLSPLVLSKPCIACLVRAISFHADPITDEVFAKVELHPVESHGSFSASEARSDFTAHDENWITSFAKILTASDANNGGGFSVPRYCAESIFPPLDYQDDPPVQMLVVRDIHGDSWNFRHIYRGTPRRHLLTTGWSKFVNSKKLVAGDSALFMKNAAGEMFVGIRRAVRASDAGDCSQWRMQIGAAKVKVDEQYSVEGGFSGDGRGRVPLESIVNAMEMAARGLPFEVIYYPRTGWSDFIVKTDLVEAAMRMCWIPGIRVKMAVETDDTSRMTWFQGTVSSTLVPDKGPWQGSPWRMVQIQWDEPEVIWNARSVNPWQVEAVLASSSPFHFMFPPTKRLRSASVHTHSEFGSEREEETHFPISRFTTSTMGGTHLNQPLLKNNISPVGIQGTRQDAHVASTFSNYFNGYTFPSGSGADLTLHTAPRLKTLSTELNISCSSENLSPDSLSSGLSSETPKVVRFKLFGELICMEKSYEGGSDDGCLDDHGSRESPQVDNMLSLSSAGCYGKLLE